MFKEEYKEERFDVDRERDAFVDEILNIDEGLTEEEFEDISNILDDIE